MYYISECGLPCCLVCCVLRVGSTSLLGAYFTLWWVLGDVSLSMGLIFSCFLCFFSFSFFVSVGLCFLYVSEQRSFGSLIPTDLSWKALVHSLHSFSGFVVVSFGFCFSGCFGTRFIGLVSSGFLFDILACMYYVVFGFVVGFLLRRMLWFVSLISYFRLLFSLILLLVSGLGFVF